MRTRLDRGWQGGKNSKVHLELVGQLLVCHAVGRARRGAALPLARGDARKASKGIGMGGRGRFAKVRMLERFICRDSTAGIER